VLAEEEDGAVFLDEAGRSRIRPRTMGLTVTSFVALKRWHQHTQKGLATVTHLCRRGNDVGCIRAPPGVLQGMMMDTEPVMQEEKGPSQMAETVADWFVQDGECFHLPSRKDAAT